MQQEKKIPFFLHKPQSHQKICDINFKEISLLEYLEKILLDYTLGNKKAFSDPKTIDNYTCSSISLYLKILGVYIKQLNEENKNLKKEPVPLENIAKIQKNSLLISKFSSTQFSIYKNMDHLLKTNPSFFDLLALKVAKEFSAKITNNEEATLEAIKYIYKHPELNLEIPHSINPDRYITINVIIMDSYQNQHISHFLSTLNRYKEKFFKLSKWLNLAKKTHSTKIIQHIQRKKETLEKFLFDSLFAYITQQLLPSLPKSTVCSSLQDDLNLTQDLEEKFFGSFTPAEEQKFCNNNTNSIIHETIFLVLAYREYLIKEKTIKERQARFNSLPNIPSNASHNPLTILNGSASVHSSSTSLSPQAGTRTSLLKQFSHNSESSCSKLKPTSVEDDIQEQPETILGVLRNKSTVNVCRS